jgi:predicted RND superfamily exporter protein
VVKVITRALERYSDLVVDRPLALLASAFIVMILLGAGGSRVDTVEQNTEDLLPDSIASVAAFDTIASEFSRAGGTRYTVLLETEPKYPGSNEVRDVRDPRMVSYVMRVTNDISRMEKVVAVSSPASIFQQPPSTESETQGVLDRVGKDRWSSFISEDYTAMKLEVVSSGLSTDEQDELANRIRTAVERDGQPPGVEASYTGDVYLNQAFQQQTQNTMQSTSILSLVGVFLIVVLLFRSVFDGVTSLFALVYGIIVGYGIYGFLGLDMSPATSGALSMGIGIAIDFGIQTVSRYREEKDNGDIRFAVRETVTGVSRPMSIALVAALIGFASLNVGRITFLSELGTLLSLTTSLAFIGALWIIPPALVSYDRHLGPRVKRYFRGETQ